MERITKRDYKFTLLNIMQGLARYTEIDEIMSRLAAYEDTNLTPSDIADMLSEVERLKAELSSSQRREKAAVEDLEKATPRWCCKNRSKDYCPISTVTGLPDCSYCGDWSWCGPRDGEEHP